MITMEELKHRIQTAGSMTADELSSLLRSCPEWVKAEAAREAKMKAADSAFRKEEAPLLADLAAVGLEAGSVYDLVNSTNTYSQAIPILLEHLSRPYHPRIREGIARALTVREGRGTAGGPILAELREERDSEVRWALANALTLVASAAERDQICALVNDVAFEDVRERLTKAMKQALKS